MHGAPRLSIIVPVLADRAALLALLARIPPDPRIEVIVVDAGTADLEADFGDRADVRLIHALRGRAHQMNVGAAAARGDWLLFLHADSEPPDGWLAVFERETRDAVGGWFQFALDDTAWQARLVERGVALRVRLFRLPYGDQGLFVRRGVFAAMGGYRELPLMEDVDFVRRLVRAGPVVELPLPLATSSRRWREDGWLRRSARNLALVSLYFAGVAPARLARWYSR